MPYLKIQTNQTILPARRQKFLTSASQLVARQLGKPESYMMVALEDDVPMLFAGREGPAVFMELKSIGFTKEQSKPLSKALCDFINAELLVPADRIYIEFASAEGAMWGWKGETF